MPKQKEQIIVVNHSPATVITEWMCENCFLCQSYLSERDAATVACPAAAELSRAAFTRSNIDFDTIRFTGVCRFIRMNNTFLVTLIKQCFHFKPEPDVGLQPADFGLPN